MLYSIYEGPKASIEGGSFVFNCEPEDLDAAWEALFDNVHLDNEQDFMDFASPDGSDVEAMLNSMNEMGFIGSWEVDD